MFHKRRSWTPPIPATETATPNRHPPRTPAVAWWDVGGDGGVVGESRDARGASWRRWLTPGACAKITSCRRWCLWVPIPRVVQWGVVRFEVGSTLPTPVDGGSASKIVEIDTSACGVWPEVRAEVAIWAIVRWSVGATGATTAAGRRPSSPSQVRYWTRRTGTVCGLGVVLG
jgi:hypothetical protein